jgi:hypothetical protein
VAESDLVLGSPEQDGAAGPKALSRPETLANLHPPRHILLRLWDVYVDRIDPLLKILHLPTFWASLATAVERPQDTSRSLDALIGAFYLATIACLEENECRALLGGHKQILFARHERAARQALRRAGFLHTTDPMTLRAYVLFLVNPPHYSFVLGKLTSSRWV